jgi:predicted acylesterase/phospholipase RssA
MAAAALRPIALSFSGSGLLLTYHLGVASHLLRPGGPLRARITRFVGVSGGALAATTCALLGPEALLDFADRYTCRGQAWSGILDALQVQSPGLGVGQRADDDAAWPQQGARREDGAGVDSHSRASRAHVDAEAAARLSGMLYIGATEC